ncbi:oligosaccharide flippase family protein [Sulfurimonas autotrophica]|uniref:oligosaccharide flippase family protein n=1 Tax=Sulfurimonas autotrophica TaxID=202747 RepID=UPI00145CD35E|nr:oligosaccharide flippase family protein [Sulfurimonas autotrophica]
MNIELFVLIIGRVLQVLIAFIAIKIVTYYLVASELGNYYLIVSLASFYGFFFVGPVGQYINRKTHQWYMEKNLLNVLYLYNYYVVFLSFSSLVMVEILKYFHVIGSIDTVLLSTVLFIYIIAHTWNQTIIPLLNMLEHRISFVVFTVLSQILSLIFAYFLINLFSKEGVIWFFGQAISFGVVSLMAFWYFICKIDNHFNILIAHKLLTKKSIKKVLNFSIPLFIGALFFWIQTQSYPLIIKKYVGSEFLGYFGVGMSIAFAISSAFESIIMQYIYPQMYKNMNNEDKFSQTMLNIVNLIIPIYLLLSIFVSFFALYIISVLVDEKYFSSYIYIIFGIWIAFFRMSSNLIANTAHSKMKTKKLVFPNFIGAVLAFFGILFAVQSSNYMVYIPSAMLLSSIVSFLVLYDSMNKLLNIYFKFKNFFLVFLYSAPFLISMFFYNYSQNIIYALMILIVFGIYFLYVLYELVKGGNNIE